MRNVKGKELIPIKQAWIDQDGKLISFHPIDSGQLLKATEPLFWEKIISLSNTVLLSVDKMKKIGAPLALQ